MQLQQETGNKQHVFFESHLNRNFNSVDSILVVSVLFDCTTLAVFDKESKTLTTYKICDKFSYKKDFWFELNFYKILYIDFNSNLNIIPNEYLNLDFERFGFKLNYSEESLNYNQHLYYSNLINFAKKVKLSNSLFLNKINSKIVFLLIHDEKILFFNSFNCQSKEDFLYFLSAILQSNQISQQEINIKFHYDFLENQEFLTYLKLFFTQISVLTSSHIEEDYDLINERLFSSIIRIECE